MDFSLRFLFMLAFTPTACVVALKRPFYGLLALVAMYYFRPEVWGAPTWFRPQLWLTVAVGIGWLSQLREFRWTTLSSLAALVVGGFFASAPFAASDSAVAFDGAVVLAKLVTVMVLTTNLVDTPKRMNWFLWANVLGFVYNLKAIFIAGFSGGNLDNAARVDVGVGQGGGSNYIAMICGIAFAILYVRWLHGVRREKLWAGALMAIYLVALVLTGSRAGFLSVAALGAYFVVRSERKVAGFASLALLAVLFFAVVPQQQLERFKQGFSTGGGRSGDLFSTGRGQDFSAKSRTILWFQAALPMFRENPVQGVGIDNFQLLSPKYAGFYASRNFEPYEPGKKGRGFVAHSTWFQMLAEGGLMVSVPYFAMFFVAFWNLRSVRRSKSRDPRIPTLRTQAVQLEGVFVAFVVSSTFGSHLKIDFYWWYMGAVAALALMNRRIVAAEAGRAAVERRAAIVAARAAIGPLSAARSPAPAPA